MRDSNPRSPGKSVRQREIHEKPRAIPLDHTTVTSTTVITFRNILISEFMTIVVVFAPRIVLGFGLMKIDYVFLINALNMFLNLVDQIHGAR